MCTSMDEATKGIMGNDVEVQTACSKQFVELLKISDPPYQEIIDSGVVPRFALFLQCDDKPDLQSYAATCLAYLAYSDKTEHVSSVVEADTIPSFVRLLKTTTNEDTSKSSVRALGYIAFECPRFRDLVLDEGAMQPLLMHLEKHLNLMLESQEKTDLNALRAASSSLSYFCRGTPKPKFEIVQSSLPTLKRLLAVPDNEVLEYACYALEDILTEESNENMKAILEAGVTPRLVELLKNASLQACALAVVVTISTANDETVQVLINHGVLPNILSLLSSPSEVIRCKACLTIRNITAGHMEQMQAIIDNKIIPLLIQRLADKEYDTRYEAAIAIRNVACCGSIQQVKCLVNEGCIAALSDLLEADMDPDVVVVALGGLERILKVGEELSRQVKFNQMATLLSEAQGLTRIQKLLDHHNAKVSANCRSILQTFFPVICNTQEVTPEDASEDNNDSMAATSGETEPQLKRVRFSEPDLLIIVGKDADRKEYRCFSQTMAAQSRFIDARLTSGIGEQDKRVDFTDLSPKVWDLMMKFLKPQESQNMTAKDVIVVAPAYDQYEFSDGLECCDRVLSDYIKKLTHDTAEAADLEFLIDAFLLCDETNLVKAKQNAIRYFRDKLASTGPLGRILFAEEHIRKLAPLIAKENLLKDDGWTKEEMLCPLFPAHLVRTWASWRSDNELVKAVHRFKVESEEVSGTFVKNSDFEYVCQQSMHRRGTNHVYKITQCNCHSDWVLQMRERGNAADGDWKTLWKCPNSRNFRLPPKENWIAVLGTGSKPKILEYMLSKTL